MSVGGPRGPNRRATGYRPVRSPGVAPASRSTGTVQQLEWTFVGREEHIATLVSNLSSGHSVMLVGHAGYGKTTLARQSLAALSDSSVIFHLRGSAITAGLPYGAVGPLITDLDDGDLAHPLMVLQKVASRLHELAAGKPVVLLADNIQYLDELSALVISQLTAQGIVTLLAVCESVADTPPEFQYLWRDGVLVRMDLGPMTYGEAGRVLGQELGSRLASFTVAELWSAAAGNPLLLRLLIQQQISTRNLIRSGAGWALRGPIILDEGPLKDIVLGRLKSLSEDELQVIEGLSLAGTLPLAALHHVVPSARLDALEEQGLIRIGKTSTHPVRIQIPAVAEVVRRHVPPGRSSMLCGAIQDWHTGTSWTGGEAQRFATWTMSCGYPLTHQAALTASQHANAQQDGQRALRFLEAVSSAQLSANMVAEKVRALTGLERYDAAHALLNQHEARRRLSDRQPEPPASETTEGGKQAAPISPLEAAGLELALSTQDSRDAIDVLAALPAPRQGETADPSTAVLLSGIWAVIGRADDGASLAAQALSQYSYPEAGRHRTGAALLHSLFISGRWPELTELMRQHADEGYNGDSSSAAVYEAIEGAMQSFCGRHREALQLLQPAIDQLRLRNTCGLLPLALAAAAYAYGLQGNAKISAVLLDEMSGEGTQRRQLPYLARFFVALSAEQAASQTAERGTSIRYRTSPLLEAAAQWRQAGALSYEMLALASALLLGHGEAADRLITIAPKIQGPMAELSLMYARGAASKDAGGLVGAAQFAEALGQQLWSASMAAEALACGSQALTTEQVIRAQMMIAGENAPSSNGKGGTGVGSLTEREREIALRAVSGASNRQIASELNLSTRTVEGHLYQIYSKMRISSRSELSMALS